MRQQPPCTPRTRSLAKGSLFLALLLATTTALAAGQVKNTAFEVDGNAHEQATVGVDWEAVAPNGVVTGAMADVFFTDSVTGNDEMFGGGAKDVRDISQWPATTAEPPDKNDIEHAFAAAFDVDGDLVVYFGLDRYSTEGDSAMGFWFFKNEVTVNATATGFIGAHAVGDILVTSDNVNGGTVSVINVFEWIGGRNPLRLLASSTTGGGTTDANGVFCLASGLACAVRNGIAQPVPSSWGGFTFKGTSGSLSSFPQFAFYEGGVNISALLGTTDKPCFSTFMAMTRTSASETAQLKDFALASFPLCGIAVTKSCVGNGTVSSTGDSFNYTYDVPITNIGAGTVYGVTLEEDSTLGGTLGTTCKIDGTTVAKDQAIEVIASLGPGATESVTVTCNSRSGTLDNAVTARAKSSVSAANPDLEASDTSDQCSASVTPGLSVTKTCHTGETNNPTGVRIVPGGFEVCVDFTITNTSLEKLVNLKVVDAKFTNPLLVDNGTLAPGATYANLTNKCYVVSTPDGTPPEDTPSQATFTNGVQVEAIGDLSRIKVGDATTGSTFEASATCKLCPCTGTGCPP